MTRVFLAEPHHAPLFDTVHDDVFDGPILPDMLASYLADPKQHIVVAMDGEVMCGMCSGLHHHHPDKRPDMWINELSVAEPWRRRGFATRMIGALRAHGQSLGCIEIWVVADPTDMAEGVYTSLGWTRTGTRLAMFSDTL
ncbi:GNAT family N-acetyltransferase [Jannaschia sp. CCS1]|uniref:GNAT family N-acetyltransferase n=1 Tax=Jannaschia sp. (strain CCS1) TaxID=290400 RepID=UPI0002D988D1|nr:GNAT family N-acetyltransferase [Jannaschia sp. CCS1]